LAIVPFARPAPQHAAHAKSGDIVKDEEGWAQVDVDALFVEDPAPPAPATGGGGPPLRSFFASAGLGCIVAGTALPFAHAAAAVAVPPALAAEQEAADLQFALQAKPLPPGCGQMSREAKKARKALKGQPRGAKKSGLKTRKGRKGQQRSRPGAVPAPAAPPAARQPVPGAAPAPPTDAGAGLNMSRKCVHSRIYHRTRTALLREGVDKETAKQRAAEAARQAVAEL
jgi:hypothetical protein